MKFVIIVLLALAPIVSHASSNGVDEMIQRLHDMADDADQHPDPRDHQIYSRQLVRQTELMKYYIKEKRRDFSHAHGDEKHELGGQIVDLQEALDRWGADHEDKHDAKTYVYRHSSSLGAQ